MKAPEKVFYNTCALYVKMFIQIIIGLYLTRVVLNSLGVEDYGIYNLIGGVIALLSFLQTALNVSSQRFLSVAKGKGDEDGVRTIFMSSLAIHIVLSITVIVLLEIGALFLFDGFLNIPENRISSAKIVYQIMAISTFISIYQVPYSAAITANEDLWFFAMVETVSSLAKLYIIVLFANSDNDPLIVYSLWMLFIIVLAFLPKFIWCKIKYSETRGRFFQNCSKSKIHEMIGFTGWNSFGTLALVGRNQGVAILLNIFWGASINAVYGIANQVNGQLINFSQIMTTSITPQIMKSEGEGNRNRMLSLSMFASKMAFFMSAFFAIPLIVELNFVLNVWLKNVPEYTELYCVLILIMFLVMQLYPGLTRAIQATGKIRNYQVITSLLLLLPIPVGYLMYKAGMHNSTVLYLMVVSQVCQMIYAIHYAKVNIGLSVSIYYGFITKAIICFITILLLGIIVRRSLESTMNSYILFFIIVLATTLLFSCAYYSFVFSKYERNMLKDLFFTILRRK